MIEESDEKVLSVIEGDVLSPDYIEELVAFVGDAPDETLQLTRERDQLRAEIKNLMQLVACGTNPTTTAPENNRRRSGDRAA